MSADFVASSAQKVESLISHDQGENAAQALGKYFQVMTPHEFKSLLTCVKADNEADLARDKTLPGVQIFHFEDSTELDVTTPNAKYPHLFRDSKPIFADVESRYQMQDPFRTGSGETVIAGDNSFVIASGHGHVIAGAGSHVTANDTTDVVARAGSMVQGQDHATITAEKGSYASAIDHAHIHAKAGSEVEGYDDATVTADAGASVRLNQRATLTK